MEMMPLGSREGRGGNYPKVLATAQCKGRISQVKTLAAPPVTNTSSCYPRFPILHLSSRLTTGPAIPSVDLIPCGM